jgi:hypothetical protein
MHSPELAKIAVVMMECDVLGALGEVQRYLPYEAYKRLHAAVYTLAARVEQPSGLPLQSWGDWLPGPTVP